LTIRSDDVAGGFDAYRKAVADELLARKQLDRAVDLYAHGAVAEQDLEVAQDAAEDAKVTLATATEHLRLLGNDPDKPMGIVGRRCAQRGCHHRSGSHQRGSGASLLVAKSVYDF
jgi:membrane fusion protein, heavy metal efflux system